MTLFILFGVVAAYGGSSFPVADVRGTSDHLTRSNELWKGSSQMPFANPPNAVTNATGTGISVDLGFNASATDGNFGTVTDSVVQPDGKIIAVGVFQRVNGTRTNGVVRLNPDGSTDHSFVYVGGGPERKINAVELQSDGKILIAEEFLISRVNSDGSVDTTFHVSIPFSGSVLDLLLLPSGKILVAGRFSGISSRLIRLNSDGSLDTAISGFTGTVRALAFAPNGKILVGGAFSSPRPDLARLNSDGSFDDTFAPTTGGGGRAIYDIAVQPDGKVIAAGVFNSFNGTATDGLVRLHENGQVDTTFEIYDIPSINSYAVHSVALQPDGKILAGFFEDGSTGFGDVRRFNSDGTLDTTFNTNSDDTLKVMRLEVLADGRILAGGNFVSFGQEKRLRLLILNGDGTLDSNFDPDLSTYGTIRAIKRLADGKILIGGAFEYINGARRTGIARLNPDGTLDETFDAGDEFSGIVYAIEIQPDGRIVIGGNFTVDRNFSAAGAARLNPDGTLDANLNAGPDAVYTATAIALQPDGKILIGGQIANSTGNFIAMIRVLSDGSSDPSFTAPQINGLVRAILVQPNNKIVFGGNFLSGINGVGRLNSDGSLETGSFGGAWSVYSLKQRADGSIYAAGSTLTRYDPEGVLDSTLDIGTAFNDNIAVMEIQPDNKIILAGYFTSFNGTAVGRIVRLNVDGSLDPTFNKAAGASGEIHSLAVLPDGKMLAGGKFLDFNGIERLGMVRLTLPVGLRRSLFDFDGDSKSDLSVRRPSNNIWYLQRGTAGYTAMQFGEVGDRMAPADYDGDGKTDVAVFRPSNGTWYIYMSQSQTFQTFGWGQDGDLPVPTDRDADGKTDLVIFRPSNNTWYTCFANGTFNTFEFGVAGDKPVVGDFDGDGKGDIALYRPSNNNWYLLKSNLGFFVQTWGEAGDLPITGDFDGDGATDQAVFRPSTGTWYLSRTTAGFSSQSWGQAGDIPIAADYDGDGKTDVAVFRPSNGQWYIVQSGSGILVLPFGQDGDAPTQSAFNY